VSTAAGPVQITVPRSSGKNQGVYLRWAANTQGRRAITAFAHNARVQSPWAAKLYAGARARANGSVALWDQRAR
jgi:hypothetical protein